MRRLLQHFDGDIGCLFEAMGITSMDVLLGMHDSDAAAFFDVFMAVLSTTAGAQWRTFARGHRAELVAVWQAARACAHRAGQEALHEALADMAAPAPPAVPRAAVGHGLASGGGHRRRSVAPYPTAKRAQPLPRDAAGLPSLRAKEAGMKAKWVAQLRAIAARAGAAAAAMHDLERLASELNADAPDLQDAVLGRGAWRTLQGHARTWLAFEKWCREQPPPPFPPRPAQVVGYCLWRARRGCGPSVIPSIRASIAWMCQRLGMQAPDPRDPAVLALEDQVIEQRGKEIREAGPLEIDVLKVLEEAVVGWAESRRLADAVCAWWVLCMTWGSMRFDDAVHIHPSSLRLTEFALYATAWQTKVERRRQGTHFAVCNTSLGGHPWLKVGTKAFFDLLPDDREHIDFWLGDVSSKGISFDAALDRERFVAVARAMMRRALCEFGRGLSTAAGEACSRSVDRFTAHSPRVTILDAMAHHGSSETQLMVQGNWKDGRMPVKYLRERKAIPLACVRQMALDMVQGWRPASSPTASSVAQSGAGAPAAAAGDAGRDVEVLGKDDVGDDDDEGGFDEHVPTFWVRDKCQADGKYEYRVHATGPGTPGRLACNSFPLSAAVPLGPYVSDFAALCGRCKKRVPQLEALVAPP